MHNRVSPHSGARTRTMRSMHAGRLSEPLVPWSSVFQVSTAQQHRFSAHLLDLQTFFCPNRLAQLDAEMQNALAASLQAAAAAVHQQLAPPSPWKRLAALRGDADARVLTS